MKSGRTASLLKQFFTGFSAKKAAQISFRYFMYLGFALSVACTSGNCRQNRDASENLKPLSPEEQKTLNEVSSSQNRVWVAKSNNAKQCQKSSGIDPKVMQKDLESAGISVFSASMKSDGMMRMTLCDSPAGEFNVYEIDRKDLSKAKSLQFKEWPNP